MAFDLYLWLNFPFIDKTKNRSTKCLPVLLRHSFEVIALSNKTVKESFEAGGNM